MFRRLPVADPVPNYVSFDEIDTIRVITISIIIWGHSLLGWEEQLSAGPFQSYLTTIVFQIGKIGTIIFFIIAGFFLRNKLPGYTLKGYFIGRWPRVYLPWILFMCIFLLFGIVGELPLSEIWRHRNINLLRQGVYNLIVGLFFYTSYWFITTYAISMAMLVLFRKHSEKMWLGLMLGAMTIFYAFNLYYQWIPANHGKALFGYAFWVWIGIQTHKHFDFVSSYLKKVPWLMFAIVFLIFFIVSCAEGRVLQALGCVDPYASNRFSNSILSLIFFAALLKLGRVRWINNLQPRNLVYGIFLLHNIVVYGLTLLLKSLFLPQPIKNIWMLLVFQILFFAVVVIITYSTISLISNSKYRWAIGLRKISEKEFAGHLPA